MESKNKELAHAKEIRFSKSKLMAGIQCPKRLYLSIHRPNLAPPIDAATQAIFDQGHAVGIEARKCFPGGILIDVPYSEPEKAIAQTKVMINSGTLVLYEAAFLHENVLVRVDILLRSEVGAPWQIIEAKSTTEAKDQHIQDIAIQTWVLRSLGLAVASASILHLNNEFVYPDRGELFTRVDVTDRISETTSMIPSLLKSLRETLLKSEVPSIDIGSHCSDPYECEFQKHCWAAKQIPEISIFNLPGLSSKRKWEYYKNGIISLSDPRLSLEKLNATQSKMIEVSNTGSRSVNQEGIRNELNQWQFPLYFLDFETIGTALPRYPGTRPYQQLPFQFSCHIQMKKGGPLTHHEYLHDNDSDPRKALVEKLLEAIGSSGSVVAYNKGFEAMRIADLANTFPEHKERLLEIRSRLVDPLPIIRSFVYDRSFCGSFSIKSVAPALLGDSMSYEGMEVSNGTEAQIGYQKLISNSLTPQERDHLKQRMLEYCRKDTIAMVTLVEWLRNTVGDTIQQSVA